MTIELIKKIDAQGNWFMIMVNGNCEKCFKYTEKDYTIKLIEAVTEFDKVKERLVIARTEVLKSVTL